MQRILVGVISLGLLVGGCGSAKKSPTTSQSIGASGGTLSSGAVTLTVPAGALSGSQAITVTESAEAAPAGYSGLSPLYQFSPDGLVFQKPVTVSLGFTSPATNPTVYWSNSGGSYDGVATTIAGTQAQAQITRLGRGFVAEAPVTAESAKAMTSFSFADLSASGAIDENAKTIAVTVPAGTDVSTLVATFTTTGASVSVGGAPQVSGTTANNFTSPVTYTVTAADASTASYVVTVTISSQAAPAAPAITYPAASAAIVVPATVQGTAADNATIDVTVMNGTTSIGTASGTANGSGVFDVFVPAYTAPSASTALSLVVTQTVGGLTSAPATLGVVQGTAVTKQFGANQTGGATTGATVYLQIFASTSSILPLQQQSFPVTTGSNAPDNSDTFSFAYTLNGVTFAFFAFRDSNDNGVFDAGEPSTNGGVPMSEHAFQQGNVAVDLPMQ